jgi:hypothetical protein
MEDEYAGYGEIEMWIYNSARESRYANAGMNGI